MSLPSFPAQDLAKLVLGYLAEEQLMTAYDEFLHASPYLDALRNEYDRIFMMSLKHVLAEYRAVKICVETCKPFALRKRLFECSNLLEVVKFLIQHIDMNSIHSQDSAAFTNSTEKASSTVQSKASTCEVCSLNPSVCMCKNKSKNLLIQSTSNTEISNSDPTSVETTSLEDLPGNFRKKHVKVLEKEKQSNSIMSSEQNSDLSYRQEHDGSPALVDNSPVSSFQDNVSTKSVYMPETSDNNTVLHHQNNLPENIKNPMESEEKIVEFNNILKSVCKDESLTQQKSNIDTEHIESNTSSVASTFQEFTTGVTGSGNVQTSSQSNVSLSLNTPVLVTKETNVNDSKQENKLNKTRSKKGVTKAHILLKVGNLNNNSTTHLPDYNVKSNEATVGKNSCFKQVGLLKPKPNDQKITILSDIKVDKTYSKTNNGTKMPALLKNATSTPLMQMQTILINGTPAYRSENKPFPQIGQVCNYTRDEIMAMPTIILVPSSTPGLSQVPSIKSEGAESRLITTQSTVATTSTNSSTNRCFEPLVIDVSTNNSNSVNKTDNSNIKLTVDSQKEVNENALLIKTVDLRNASVPKDNEISNRNTPQAPPPARKSSSTPRRNSHVRVLDFTTPRRILQETIIEHVENQNCDKPVEIVISKSSNLHTLVDAACSETINKGNSNFNTLDSSDNTMGMKENVHKLVPVKKHNWDAELRALAVGNQEQKQEELSVKPKSKMKSCKKKNSSSHIQDDGDNMSEKKSVSKNKSTKNKVKKNKPICDEFVEKPVINNIEEKTTVALKPTINIIARHDWDAMTQIHDKEKNQNKSNEEQADTPEMDRISLQNAIGVKLNISELLETPYKQALYDIQMETPRFLGPDLPDEPVSDIKIMNIPTPRFFNTPKPAQSTPSSYSSRPTDYSSGGSYYKPDDQDYTPGDLGYPLLSPKVVSTNDNDDKEKITKPSRPVRKCTKNVSYYNTPTISNKTKDINADAGLSSNECNSNTTCEKKTETSKSSKEKSKTSEKTEVRRKSTGIKKRKSPIKKETIKTFMKIKPRRTTPIKDAGRKKRRQSEAPVRKRTFSKEKNMNITPIVVSAPTKSRRKSSTPRKLHCTKMFNSESSGHDSPEMFAKIKPTGTRDPNLLSIQDSDTEQLPLRWSDDGSQDAKSTEAQIPPIVNESDDITKIQAYIAESEACNLNTADQESNLHVDLVKRGFDIETAKIIERDLLDTPPHPKENTVKNLNLETNDIINVENSLEKNTQSDANLDNEEEENEIELSVHECNEETDNYITVQHDDTTDLPQTPLEKLKDKFCMEVCIDDDEVIRLRATTLDWLIDRYAEEMTPYNHTETEMAVCSISNIEKLYTPMKDSVKAQCYEIFDSTLTSLDTPLKISSPKRKEHGITEIVLEVEKLEVKEKVEAKEKGDVKEKEVKEKVDVKKRKRLQNGNTSDDSASDNKRSKSESQYLLNTPNIQNIDIETVLYKLHGP